MSGDDIVHEVEELDAPSALLVSGHHFAGGHLEDGKRLRGPIALVFVAVTGQSQPVRELQKSLRPLLFISDSGYQGGFR